MQTLQDKLTQMLHAKTNIKNAIIAKGVDISASTPFSDYADKINEIGKPPWIQITQDNWFDYINTPNMYSWESNDTMAITAPTGEYPWIVENSKTLDSFKLEVDLPMDSMWFNGFNGERITGVGKHELIVNRGTGSGKDWSKVSFGWGSAGTEFPSGSQPKVKIWVRLPEEPPAPAIEYVTGTFKDVDSGVVEASVRIYDETNQWKSQTIENLSEKKIKILKNSIIILDTSTRGFNIVGDAIQDDTISVNMGHGIYICHVRGDFTVTFNGGTGEPI